MATGGSGDGREDRLPKDLKGLLQFCAEAQTEETESEFQNLPPLSDERRQFLEDVLGSLQATDPIKVMIQNVKVVLEAGDTDEDKENVEDALEELQMHVEDVDLANDFYKIGGYVLLDPLLSNSHAGYRWRTAELIGTVAQNNPTSQERLVEANVFPTLIRILENDGNDTARVKALYAISCMCREFQPAQDKLLNDHDGFSVLIRATQSNIDKIQTKATFMLAALCTENPAYKATLVGMGLIEQLIGLLHQPHSPHHEHLMRLAVILCEDYHLARNECRRPEFNFSILLNDRCRLLQGKEEYQEELEYTRKLQQMCFHNKDKADR